MPIALILILPLILIAFYVIGVYNSLQTLKTRIEASIQEIGNQLKRQASLIPNLAESAKSYLEHEKEIFDKLTSARKAVDRAVKSGDMEQINQAADEVSSLIPALNVAVEDNPELKADNVVMRLMDELRDTADKLLFARRTVIDLTQNYNQKLVVFPSNVVANMFGFKKEKGIPTPMEGGHMEVSSDETKDVKIDL